MHISLIALQRTFYDYLINSKFFLQKETFKMCLIFLEARFLFTVNIAIETLCKKKLQLLLKQ